MSDKQNNPENLIDDFIEKAKLYLPPKEDYFSSYLGIALHEIPTPERMHLLSDYQFLMKRHLARFAAQEAVRQQILVSTNTRPSNLQVEFRQLLSRRDSQRQRYDRSALPEFVHQGIRENIGELDQAIGAIIGEQFAKGTLKKFMSCLDWRDTNATRTMNERVLESYLALSAMHFKKSQELFTGGIHIIFIDDIRELVFTDKFEGSTSAFNKAIRNLGFDGLPRNKGHMLQVLSENT